MKPFKLYGIPVYTDRHLTEPKLVEHDRSRFIEYEEKDLGWRLFFGFAEYKSVPSTTVVHIRMPPSLFGRVARPQEYLVMHPDLLEMIKKEPPPAKAMR